MSLYFFGFLIFGVVSHKEEILQNIYGYYYETEHDNSRRRNAHVQKIGGIQVDIYTQACNLKTHGVFGGSANDVFLTKID